MSFFDALLSVCRKNVNLNLQCKTITFKTVNNNLKIFNHDIEDSGTPKKQF